MTTCRECEHVRMEDSSHTGLVCAVPLPNNLVAAIRHLPGVVDENGFVPDAPTRGDDSCALYEEADFPVLDEGDV